MPASTLRERDTCGISKQPPHHDTPLRTRTSQRAAGRRATEPRDLLCSSRNAADSMGRGSNHSRVLRHTYDVVRTLCRPRVSQLAKQPQPLPQVCPAHGCPPGAQLEHVMRAHDSHRGGRSRWIAQNRYARPGRGVLDYLPAELHKPVHPQRDAHSLPVQARMLPAPHPAFQLFQCVGELERTLDNPTWPPTIYARDRLARQ
mmetsp:Transcript_8579/g.17267  ORF Transcript_8579/g.17267 Transcript_8579/m.17267 type:complete len:202 (-) Transcript_8579:41-646(-)